MNGYPLYLWRAMEKAGVPLSHLCRPIDGLPPGRILMEQDPGAAAWASMRAEAHAAAAKARATIHARKIVEKSGLTGLQSSGKRG